MRLAGSASSGAISSAVQRSCKTFRVSPLLIGRPSADRAATLCGACIDRQPSGDAMGPWGTEPCGCGTRAWRGGGSCGLSRKEQVTLALGVLTALAGDFDVIGVALDIHIVQPHRGGSAGMGAGAPKGHDTGLPGSQLCI